MQVIEYFSCDRPEHWLCEIKKSDWSAGQFLYKLLSENKFKNAVGEHSKVRKRYKTHRNEKKCML